MPFYFEEFAAFSSSSVFFPSLVVLSVLMLFMHHVMAGLQGRGMSGFMKTMDDFLDRKNDVEGIRGASVNIDENKLPRETKMVVLSPE